MLTWLAGVAIAIAVAIGGVFNINNHNQSPSVAVQNATITASPSGSPNAAPSNTPAQAAVAVSGSNPFQTLYNFFPSGGQVQSCMKSLLGTNFNAVLNGGTPPASLVVNKSNGVSESFAPAVETCINTHSGTQVLNSMPVPVQQCYKDALGANFQNMMSGSYTPTADEQNQIVNCSAVKEMTGLMASLEQYSKEQLGITQIKDGCTYAVNLANVPIQVEMSAGENGKGVPTGMDNKEISSATVSRKQGTPILQLDLTASGQQMFADITKQMTAQPNSYLLITANGKPASSPVLVGTTINESQLMIELPSPVDADIVSLFGGKNLTSSCGS